MTEYWGQKLRLFVLLVMLVLLRYLEYAPIHSVVSGRGICKAAKEPITSYDQVYMFPQGLLIDEYLLVPTRALSYVLVVNVHWVVSNPGASHIII